MTEATYTDSKTQTVPNGPDTNTRDQTWAVSGPLSIVCLQS